MSLAENLRSFRFRQAFIDDLGWNPPSKPGATRTVLGRDLTFTPIAEQGGVSILEVTEQHPKPGESITAPRTRSIRMAADREITALFQVHVLIFPNAKRTESVWQLSKAEKDKRIVRERRYYAGGPTQPHVTLLKGLHIPYEMLDDRGDVSHTAMLEKLEKSGAFAAKVEKKFYREFDILRKGFDKFLEWIEDEQKRSWYITALLNRIMFIYFVQHKELLGGDTGYLRRRLDESPRGENRFYRDFFLPLCFFGFGAEQGKRGRFEAQFKAVPYLDGGLFLLHEVEKEVGISEARVAAGNLPGNAVIPDAEFDRWFKFFDDWRWTLDEENPENDKEINPAILGYIFEKYVNQKQMGAYYTKEDITGYICRNTIIPRLFDMLAETGAAGNKAVEPLPIGPHPNLFNDGKGISQGEGIDRYIYGAVKTTDYLPTETEREYDARQKRYLSILQDFDDGKITTVNDFITWNLDIERMALDFVATIQDAEVLRRLYFDCIQRITVLDPTCGSGAFLFAASRILYPLYDGCLKRMEALCGSSSSSPLEMTMAGGFAFANDVDRQQAFIEPETVTDEILARFREELERIAKHPNREYYILKTIIVNNLYGVDIMDEAVEICKLRLFLKLIACAEPDAKKPNWGIEPLPDIDFNILVGNTLVGYTSIEDIDRLWATVEQGSTTRTGAFAFEKDHSKLRGLVKEYGLLVKQFRNQQLGRDLNKPARTKAHVLLARDMVKPELDEDVWRLHREAKLYDDPPRKREVDFDRTHRPFHWFVEFPEEIVSGGFDVIVGNPPYVETNKVANQYALLHQDTATLSCGNLLAHVSERSLRLSSTSGRIGLIVLVSTFSTDRMIPLQSMILNQATHTWVSNFAWRPAKLFEGVNTINSIWLSRVDRFDGSSSLYCTRYMKWNGEERPTLLNRLQYCSSLQFYRDGVFPKCEPATVGAILLKVMRDKRSLQSLFAKNDGVEGANSFYYFRGMLYWIKVMNYLPAQRENGRETISVQCRRVNVVEGIPALVPVAVMSSSLFFLYYQTYSDCQQINAREFANFPIDLTDDMVEPLALLGERLMNDYRRNSKLVNRLRHNTGVLIEKDYLTINKSKSIIDEIDRVLAKHYGFTEEELDFIINYDIKYRMGRDAGEALEGERE